MFTVSYSDQPVQSNRIIRKIDDVFNTPLRTDAVGVNPPPPPPPPPPSTPRQQPPTSMTRNLQPSQVPKPPFRDVVIQPPPPHMQNTSIHPAIQLPQPTRKPIPMRKIIPEPFQPPTQLYQTPPVIQSPKRIPQQIRGPPAPRAPDAQLAPHQQQQQSNRLNGNPPTNNNGNIPKGLVTYPESSLSWLANPLKTSSQKVIRKEPLPTQQIPSQFIQTPPQLHTLGTNHPPNINTQPKIWTPPINAPLIAGVAAATAANLTNQQHQVQPQPQQQQQQQQQQQKALMSFQAPKVQPWTLSVNEEKTELLSQFANMEADGVPMSRRFTMDDDLDEMRFAFYRIKKEQDVNASIMKYKKSLITIVSMITLLLSSFKLPFDLSFDGLLSDFNQEMTDFYPTFRKIHEKYSKIKFLENLPELQLLSKGGWTVLNRVIKNFNDKRAEKARKEAEEKEKQKERQLLLLQSMQHQPSSFYPGHYYPQYYHYAQQQQQQHQQQQHIRPLHTSTMTQTSSNTTSTTPAATSSASKSSSQVSEKSSTTTTTTSTPTTVKKSLKVPPSSQNTSPVLNLMKTLSSTTSDSGKASEPKTRTSSFYADVKPSTTTKTKQGSGVDTPVVTKNQTTDTNSASNLKSVEKQDTKIIDGNNPSTLNLPPKSSNALVL